MFSFMVLWNRAPNVFQIGILKDEDKPQELYQMWDPLRDFYSNDWGDSNDDDAIELPKVLDPKTVEYSSVPGKLQEEAQKHLTLLRSNRKIAKLFAPRPKDLLKRHTFAIECADRHTIGDKIVRVLGGAYDTNLKRSGIKYHGVPSILERRSSWVYWVAHNGEDIAGVLGGLKMSEDDYAFRLSYVSVSPAFRRQGLAKQLYSQALKYCEDNHLILVRSSPGQMTRQMTDITLGFDKLLMASHVPHLGANALNFENVMHELKLEYDWPTFCKLVKPICDTWLKDHPPSSTTWCIKPMDKKRTFDAFKKLLPEHRAQQVHTPFM